MLTKSMLVLASCCLLFAGTTQEKVETDEKLDGIKCVVMGERAAKKDKAVEYKDGEVYLCCSKCVAAFKGDKKKFATKANHQLVASGQYTQKACPITGKPVADDKKLKVAAIEVGLCCDKCVEKVGDMEMEEKVNTVFADASFKKAFEKASTVDLSKTKCFMMPKPVDSEVSADYLDGKVYFCCKRCLAKFNGNKDKYTVQANHQLVQTGQYVQTACPFSGNEVDAERSVEFADTKVAFCCGQCSGKVKTAADDKARAELVFAKDRFKKAFKKKK